MVKLRSSRWSRRIDRCADMLTAPASRRRRTGWPALEPEEQVGVADVHGDLCAACAWVNSVERGELAVRRWRRSSRKRMVLSARPSAAAAGRQLRAAAPRPRCSRFRPAEREHHRLTIRVEAPASAACHRGAQSRRADFTFSSSARPNFSGDHAGVDGDCCPIAIDAHFRPRRRIAAVLEFSTHVSPARRGNRAGASDRRVGARCEDPLLQRPDNSSVPISRILPSLQFHPFGNGNPARTMPDWPVWPAIRSGIAF